MPDRLAMHPLEKRQAAKAKKVPRQLEVRLKPGWWFDGRRRAIVSAEKSVSLRKVLPLHATVSLMPPSLAKADPRTLSEDEALLARSSFPRWSNTLRIFYGRPAIQQVD